MATAGIGPADRRPQGPSCGPYKSSTGNFRACPSLSPAPPHPGPARSTCPLGSSPTPSSSAAAEPPSYADVGPAWGRSPAHVWCPRPDLVPTLQFTASPHCPDLVFSAPSTAKSLLSSFSLRLQARRHTWPVWPRLCDLLRITALVCVPPRSFSWTPGWASDAKSWPNLIPKPDHHVKVSFFLSACGTGLPPRLTSLLTSSIFSIAHGIQDLPLLFPAPSEHGPRATALGVQGSWARCLS